jgi:hypothetical protein
MGKVESRPQGPRRRSPGNYALGRRRSGRSVGFWQRLTGRDRGAGDTSLDSKREGGAFHLWWEGLPRDAQFVEASVTLEVTQAPTATILYFWALQASFSDNAGRQLGAAHTGLQWNPRHPGSTAINWGGYASPPANAVFEGSPPSLPGFPDDPNTRDFHWEVGERYRFTIARSAGGWTSSVSTGGETIVLRELYASGDRLSGLVVWSELFCPCEVPSAEVRWSDFAARSATGELWRPSALRCTFPDPGTACLNTDSVADGDGALQRNGSGVRRSGRDGELVPLAAGGSQAAGA